jgi:hypothetical protein
MRCIDPLKITFRSGTGALGRPRQNLDEGDDYDGIAKDRIQIIKYALPSTLYDPFFLYHTQSLLWEFPSVQKQQPKRRYINTIQLLSSVGRPLNGTVVDWPLGQMDFTTVSPESVHPVDRLSYE